MARALEACIPFGSMLRCIPRKAQGIARIYLVQAIVKIVIGVHQRSEHLVRVVRVAGLLAGTRRRGTLDRRVACMQDHPSDLYPEYSCSQRQRCI